MKHHEGKVSYAVIFVRAPPAALDAGAFIAAVARFLADQLSSDPSAIFVDAEPAEEPPGAAQVNLMVASAEEAAHRLRRLFKGPAVRQLRSWKQVTRVVDSRGQALYPYDISARQ